MDNSNPEKELNSSASGLVKHLDFADVTLTLPTVSLPVGGLSEDAKTLNISAPNNNVNTQGLGENPSIEELRQEAHRIRQNLAGLHDVVTLPQAYIQEVNESEVPHANVPELKKLVSSLKSEYQELAAKEKLLKLFSEFDDEKENESWISDDVPEIESLRTELMNLKRSNSDTIKEIESLIHRVADDMSSLDSSLSLATDSLQKCDLGMDKLAESEKEKDEAELMVSQAGTPQDLEETIRLLEEQLRQNEREYEDTEAALKQRIEQYNLEMEELQAQARQLDIEEESLRMIVDLSGRCLKLQPFLESISDVAVVAVGDEFVELQLTTEVPTVGEAAPGRDVKQELKHKLYINVNSKTMEMGTAELIPADVPIDDLISSAHQISNRTSSEFFNLWNESLESTMDAENVEFGRQFAFLVRAVHHRISVFALKAASLSSAANDSRYCVEYLPDGSVVTVTIPGRLKALVEVPHGWPMHGFSLRLRSLHSLGEESPTTLEFLQEVMEQANKMPDYARHDVLSFVQAVEAIVTERNSQTRIFSW